MSNPKMWKHSASAIGLDEMIEDRREGGDLRQNVVHIEVPYGKPIEEVYEGVHTGPVLGTGASGLVRMVTHKATGIQYAVKVLDLRLVNTSEGLRQLREEIFIMCQVCNSVVDAETPPILFEALNRSHTFAITSLVGSPEHCSPRGSV
jgi:serine/threonine protein kinase